MFDFDARSRSLFGRSVGSSKSKQATVEPGEVLVICTVPAVLDELVASLEGSGFIVTGVADVEGATARLQAEPGRYGVCLVDAGDSETSPKEIGPSLRAVDPRIGIVLRSREERRPHREIDVLLQAGLSLIAVANVLTAMLYGP
ncbi:MAG: hypothetical protein HOW73_26870 [Polyangiaceae bacterium]|nr:hypothetical protein [Polyangiaceae bacterium]